MGAQSNWSTYLVQRFFATGDRRDLDTALARGEEALAMVSPASPDGPMLLNNLGAGLRVRYLLHHSATDSPESLTRSVDIYEKAVAAAYHPERPEYLNGS